MECRTLVVLAGAAPVVTSVHSGARTQGCVYRVGILLPGVHALPDHPGVATAHRILKGASPRGIPFEQPKHFELIVNRNTAKALGLALPQSLLVRAGVLE